MSNNLAPRLAALGLAAACAACSGGVSDQSFQARTALNQQPANTTTPSHAATPGREAAAAAPADAAASQNSNTSRPVFDPNISRAEFYQYREAYRTMAAQGGDKIGTGSDDGWLWVKTKSRLTQSPELKDANLNVDVENGFVTLRGTVSNEEQKRTAEDLARLVAGADQFRSLLIYEEGPKPLPRPSRTPTPKG